MYTEHYLDELFHCGLPFQIFNRPVKDDQLWDIKIFWRMGYEDDPDPVVSDGFDSILECAMDAAKWFKHSEHNTNWKGPMTPLMENGRSNIEVGNIVVLKDGTVRRVDRDDHDDFVFEDIERFATRDEALNSEKINELVKELKRERESNRSAWDRYGSELCAGEMINNERELEDKIKELRNYAGS